MLRRLTRAARKRELLLEQAAWQEVRMLRLQAKVQVAEAEEIFLLQALTPPQPPPPPPPPIQLPTYPEREELLEMPEPAEEQILQRLGPLSPPLFRPSSES